MFKALQDTPHKQRAVGVGNPRLRNQVLKILEAHGRMCRRGMGSALPFREIPVEEEARRAGQVARLRAVHCLESYCMERKMTKGEGLSEWTMASTS